MTGLTVPGRRENLLLATIAVAPFALFALIRYFGYTKYLTLAAVGGVGLVGATIIFLRPRLGLWLLLFHVYAGISALVPAVAGLLAVLIFASVVFGLVRGEENRLTDPLFWYANAFLFLISVGSILFARSPSLAFLDLSRYAKILLVTYLIVQLVRTPEDLRRMMNVIFAGAVGTVILGIIILTFGVHTTSPIYVRSSGEYMLRFAGAHENANLAAAIMCFSIPLGIFLMKHARSWMRVTYVAGVVTLIIATIATFSRSVFFPLAFLSATVVIREARSRRAYIAIASLIGLGIVLAPHSYWERVMGLRDAFETTTLDWSVYTRLLALKTGWEMFLHHPFTGVGIGNFFVAAAYRLFVRMVAHNSYLEILVGIGIFGLIAFVMVLLSGLRHSIAGARHRWTRHPAWLRSACFYWVLSAVSISMSAFFGSMPFRYFLWIPVAAGLVIGNLLAEDRRNPA